jgi:uncharacterized membrane protein YhiD involved in acid resistance
MTQPPQPISVRQICACIWAGIAIGIVLGCGVAYLTVVIPAR